MSITFTTTRVEFIHDGWYYQANRRVDGPWTLIRWPEEGPRIPPMAQSLHEDDDWRSIIANQSQSPVKTFPHLHGIEDYLDPING